MFSADSFSIALGAFILLHHDIYLTGLPVLWMFGRFHNLIYILCPISSSVILSFPSAQQCFLVSMSSVGAPFCCCCFPVSVNGFSLDTEDKVTASANTCSCLGFSANTSYCVCDVNCCNRCIGMIASFSVGRSGRISVSETVVFITDLFKLWRY